MRATLLALVAVGASHVPVTLPAQAAATLGVGVTSIRHADGATLSALSLSPALTASSARTRIAASGAWSRFGVGGSTAQGTLDLSAYLPLRPATTVELGGSGGASTRSDGYSTGQWLGVVRLLHSGSTSLGWIGGSAGSMWDGVSWRGVRQAELGLVVQPANVAWTFVLTPTDATGARFTDGRLALAVGRGRFDLHGLVGGRMGDALLADESARRFWGSAGVTAWLSERVALVAAAGTYPSDLMQGFPGGRYASMSLRFGRGGRRVEIPAANERESRAWRAARDDGIGAFSHERLANGHVRLRLHAPKARTVEIASDVTLWQVVAMHSRAEGWFELELPMADGAHELTVRVDGGRWRVPPGLPVIEDEFGGEGGWLLLVAPGAPRDVTRSSSGAVSFIKRPSPGVRA